MKNIMEKFEKVVENFPNKTLYADVETSITTLEFKNRCRLIATSIAKTGRFNRPVAVIDNRDVDTLVLMFSVVYSGNHYVCLDGASPVERLTKICANFDNLLLVCTSKTEALAQKLKLSLPGLSILNVEKETLSLDEGLLLQARSKQTAFDPVYILFTSGSTGTPKGTVITHNNLLHYVDWYATTFKIDENTIFASQTPFYFSASVSDVFSTLMYGACLNIIPKSYFSFPIQLVRYLNERKVNTIYWVPSALIVVANVKLFDYEKPLYLKKVMFAGEIMPNKQLNYWRKNLPDCMYANLLGPTEVVDTCCYYIVDREFNDDDSLPIGRHCDNADTFLVDDAGAVVTEIDRPGELYVRGPFVAAGYYNNEEATKKAFVQNPLQNHYPEIVYKTGDLAKINSHGEYEFLGRKDFQIKHKGYRIELGEIERVTRAIQKVDNAVALYDKDADAIILIYAGKCKKADLYSLLTEKLPEYMLPEILIPLFAIPLNANGKADRQYLLANYKTLKEN